MEFFRGGTLIFTKFFRGKPIFFESLQPWVNAILFNLQDWVVKSLQPWVNAILFNLQDWVVKSWLRSCEI